MKNSFLIGFAAILIFISSLQIVYLRNFIQNIEAINKSLVDNEAKIHNLEVVLSRSLGKFIEIKVPILFIEKLTDIENRLNSEISTNDIVLVEQGFNDLMRETPKWIIDEEFTRLNMLSSRIQFCKALTTAETALDQESMLLFTENHLVVPFEVKKQFEKRINTLAAAYEKKTNSELQQIDTRFENLCVNVEDNVDEYRLLSEELNPYEGIAEAQLLLAKIQDKIGLTDLSNEIKNIHASIQNPFDSGAASRLEFLSQCSNRTMLLYDSISFKYPVLKVDFETLIAKIEAEINTASREINNNANKRINAYNLWALDSINLFEKEFLEIKKNMGIFGKVKKKEGLEKIFAGLKVTMLTIDQNLLLESVREVYSKAYADAAMLLEDDNYLLELAKASATIDRKTMEDTEGYTKNLLQ